MNKMEIKKLKRFLKTNTHYYFLVWI